MGCCAGAALAYGDRPDSLGNCFMMDDPVWVVFLSIFPYYT